jgi:hypothetical protein
MATEQCPAGMTDYTLPDSWGWLLDKTAYPTTTVSPARATL